MLVVQELGLDQDLEEATLGAVALEARQVGVEVQGAVGFAAVVIRSETAEQNL